MGSSAFSHGLEFTRGLKEQAAKITTESGLRIKKKQVLNEKSYLLTLDLKFYSTNITVIT